MCTTPSSCGAPPRRLARTHQPPSGATHTLQLAVPQQPSLAFRPALSSHPDPPPVPHSTPPYPAWRQRASLTCLESGLVAALPCPRYDAAAGSLSLPEHRDTSAVSLSLALNPGEGGEGDFAGGGTWFEALGDERGRVIDAEVGHAVVFAGPLRHAGYPITSGTRFVLVLFLYVEGFPYGQLCEEYARSLPPAADCSGGGSRAGAAGKAEIMRPSGDSPNGYVVYKQTTELVKMLNKPTPSVLD